MKKFIVLVSAALLSMGIASAQDMEKATNLAKEANEALVNGDYNAAISSFKAAMEEAAQCAEEGAADLLANCKKGYTMAHNALANALAKDGKLAEAIEQYKTVAKVAIENEEAEIAEKAQEKVLQLHQAIANAKMKAAGAEKEAAAKAEAYKEALSHLDALLENNSEDGKVMLQKGQVLNALGQKDAAIAAFEKAKELGQADSANKQLSTIYLKDANALNKAQKYKEAVAMALKSIECAPSANAYKIAGIASQKAGDIPAAVENLSKYLEVSPNAADAAQIKAAVEALKAQLKK